MQITTTDQLASARGIKVLVFGPSGSGKTRLISTMSRTPAEDTLIVSAEAGLLSLRDFSIRAVEVHGVQDLRDVLTYVRSPEGVWVKNLALDSISEIAEVVLAAEKMATTEGGKPMHGAKAYGEMGDVMARILRAFRDLPGPNVYFSAKMDRNATDEGIFIGPSMPGKKLAQGLAYWFDEVFALRVAPPAQEGGRAQRWLQTANDGIYDCKDRSGALALTEPAHLGRLFAKINGESAALPTHDNNPTHDTNEVDNG